MERKRVLLFKVDLCQAVQGLCQTRFQVSFFSPQQILRILVEQYQLNFVFEGNQIYLRISESEKIRSSKVDVLLRQTAQAGISIMRQ